MFNLKNFRILFCILSGLLLAECAFADSSDKFFGTIAVTSELNDNGHKSDPEQVNERQDQIDLGLGGKYTNSLIDFNAAYNAKARTYSEDTQEESNTLEGKSSLQIGKSSQSADLLLEHSRIRLLKKPDAIDTPENQDERNITSVIPTLRGRISEVDNIYIEGQFSDVSYVEDDGKNSRRKGGVLGYEHRISVTDSVQLFAQQTDITFPNAASDDFNYLYRSVELAYSTKLRKLSYNAHIGINQSLPELGEDVQSPKYALEVSYNSGVQSFSLNLLQELTDASFGGGNSLSADGQTTGTDSAHDLDRFERKRADLLWQTYVVCESCSFIMGAYYIHDRYLVSAQTSIQKGWSSALSYDLSSASKISLQFTTGDNTFSDASFGDDYKVKTTRIEYSHQFNRGISAKCYANNEKRDALSSGGESYSENYVGLGISYTF